MENNLFASFFDANSTNNIIFACYLLARAFFICHSVLKPISSGDNTFLLLGIAITCLGTIFVIARILATTDPIEPWMQWGSLVLIILLGIGVIVPMCLLLKRTGTSPR